MANKEVDNLPLLTALTGADVYGVKTNTDYRIRAGEANGLATLGADGKVPTGQLPAGALYTAVQQGGGVGQDDTKLYFGWDGVDGVRITASTFDQGTIATRPWVLNNYSALGHTHSFSALTGKPTTLSGYGISDAQPAGSYSLVGHTHTMSHITDAGSWATKNQTVSTAAASGTPADGAVWLQYAP